MSLGKDPCVGRGEFLSSRARIQGPLGVPGTPRGPFLVLSRPASTSPGCGHIRVDAPIHLPEPGAHNPGTATSSRMLRNSFSPRLLKKVQQGGARCEVRGVLSPYVAAPRERGAPTKGGSPQMGLFSAAC